MFSHPPVKPAWLCFELHQNHHLPALRYVACIRPSVFAAFILNTSCCWVRFLLWSSVCSFTVAKTGHIPATGLSLSFHKAPLSHYQWVVKGRILTLGFQVGDSFGIWTGLQGNSKAVKHHFTAYGLLLFWVFNSRHFMSWWLLFHRPCLGTGVSAPFPRPVTEALELWFTQTWFSFTTYCGVSPTPGLQP